MGRSERESVMVVRQAHGLLVVPALSSAVRGCPSSPHRLAGANLTTNVAHHHLGSQDALLDTLDLSHPAANEAALPQLL